MTNLLLIAPLTDNLQGGMVVWTDTFLKQYDKLEIDCDLLNIAAIGSRAAKGNSKRNFLDEFVRTKAIFKNLKRLMASKKYDVAHMNTSCGAFGLIRDYLTIRKIKNVQQNCKIIVHFHCDVEFQAGSGYKKIFLNKLLSLADRAFTLNEGNRQYIERNYNVECVAVPNPINEQWLRTDEKNISDKIKKAVFVGFVQPLKGVKEIYELAGKLPGISFDLIGEVREDVKKWEKPQNLSLLGRMEHIEIIKAMDEADIFIFPTHTEGFSIALLESMARGLPSITTNVGANAEMLEDKGGIIVPTGDVQAMIDAIKVMQDPIKRQEMSQWNVEKVKQYYSSQQVMKKISFQYSCF